MERGLVPQEAGADKVYNRYQDAREDLIKRLDECCSYCGMHLDASLAVEHVKPKKTNPGCATAWANFLLGCANCNSNKGARNINVAYYLWPDSDNTDFAYIYGPDALVSVNPAMTLRERRRARNTLALVKLDVEPAASPTVSDRRWVNRQESWRLAERKRAQLALPGRDNDEFRETIADLAYRSGYWSVWMTVFRADPDMRSRIAHCVRGTAIHGCLTPAYDVHYDCLQTLVR